MVGQPEIDYRQGRRCGTCHWIKRVSQTYGVKCWCEYKPPPINREWGKHVDPVDPEKDWCSAWVWDPSNE